MSLLITNIGQLVTLAGEPGLRLGARMSELGIVNDAAVFCNDEGNIVWVGAAGELPRDLPDSAQIIDAGGRCLTPGLVDSHTHLVFAGDRCGEFYRRCAGETYADIAKAGGGIAATVAATRATDEYDLVELALPRLARMAANGTTAVEIKTGYGLTASDEVKMLNAIWGLPQLTPLNIFATYMGAHAIPPEYVSDRDAYVQQVVDTILSEDSIPKDFVDIFVDPLAFTHEEALVIIEAANQLRIPIKLHGDEFADNGTAKWGVERGAVSIDHLGGVSDEGIEALANSSTVATLLPGTMLFSGHGLFAPARRMIDAGCAVALATDLNPGSSHVYSLPLVMTLACLKMGMTAAECITACTINAAHALRAADRIGSIEVGKRADLVLWDCPSYEQIPYYVGTNLARTVIVGGKTL